MALTASNGRDSHTPLWALIALNGSENYQNYKVPSSSFSQHQWEERLKSMGTNPKSHQQDTFSPAWCFLAPVKGPLFPRVTPGRSNKARAGGQIQLVQMWERIPQATWPSIEVFTYQMDVALADAGLKNAAKIGGPYSVQYRKHQTPSKHPLIPNHMIPKPYLA